MRSVAAREDMQARSELAEEAECGVPGGRVLEGEQRLAGGLGVDGRRRDEVGEQADAVLVDDVEAVGPQELRDALGVEAPGRRVALAPPPVG